MISIGEVKWDSEKEYRLRLRDPRNEALPGVTFVGGVSVAPVRAKVVLRLYQAFGTSLSIELWTSPEAAPPPVVSKARGEKRTSPRHPPGSVDRAGRPFADRDVLPGDFDEEDETPVKAEFVSDDDDDQLCDLSKKDLRDLADTMKIRVHWNAGKGKLIEAIRAAKARV